MSHDRNPNHDTHDGATQGNQSQNSPRNASPQNSQGHQPSRGPDHPQTQETHSTDYPQAGQSGSRHQDIRNAQWLTLSRDEEIIWWGHPSLIPHLPVIVISLFSALIGIASVFVLPETLGLKGLILVPIGILGAVMDYIRVITSFYVVTNDKVVRKVGVLRRDTTEMRYENIEHVNSRQSIVERVLGYGDIDLATAGTGATEATLNDVREPRTVSQTINQRKDDAYNRIAHQQT